MEWAAAHPWLVVGVCLWLICAMLVVLATRRDLRPAGVFFAALFGPVFWLMWFIDRGVERLCEPPRRRRF